MIFKVEVILRENQIQLHIQHTVQMRKNVCANCAKQNGNKLVYASEQKLYCHALVKSAEQTRCV